MKRYGPYVNRDGYWFHTYVHANDRRTSQYLHREAMERKLKRKLLKTELVHHKDGNPANNRISNLELLSKVEHDRLHSAEKAERARPRLICCQCGIGFRRQGAQERHFRKQGKKGPFCSKSCAGRWSRQRQIAQGLSNLRIRR